MRYFSKRRNCKKKKKTYRTSNLQSRIWEFVIVRFYSDATKFKAFRVEQVTKRHLVKYSVCQATHVLIWITTWLERKMIRKHYSEADIYLFIYSISCVKTDFRVALGLPVTIRIVLIFNVMIWQSWMDARATIPTETF